MSARATNRFSKKYSVRKLISLFSDDQLAECTLPPDINSSDDFPDISESQSTHGRIQ